MNPNLSPYASGLLVALAIGTMGGCTTSNRGRNSPQEIGPPLAMAPSALPRSVIDGKVKASFDCAERATSLQDVICADPELAVLDQEMNSAFRRALRAEPIAGRSLLLGFHQHWLQTRAGNCKLSPARLTATKPDPEAVSCLRKSFQNHTQTLLTWPAPPSRTASTAHPVSAYMNFRLVDDREPLLCADMARKFDELLLGQGEANPLRLAGVNELVGTHGTNVVPGSGVVGGRTIAVELLDPGLYASYQIRAKSLSINGRRVMDDKSLSRWIQEQKNAGGRFNSLSSQTADYAAIDVFRLHGRDFALVSEPWAYYSPASKGEAAFAGLYEIVNDTPTPRCLYKLFLAQPVAGVVERLPALKQLIQTLDAMTGAPAALRANLSPNERQDRALLRDEALWTQLTLPLIAIDDANLPNRNLALRRQHDEMMEAIFSWSERNAAAKQRYRELMPLIAPAHAELVTMYQGTHGLTAGEAVAAADLVMMETIAYAAENLAHDHKIHTALPTAQTTYVPRYSPAPLPGALEQGRQFSGLHSALINQAPPPVITDFINYEYGEAARKRGRTKRGASGETALMAAAGQPELVLRLLVAGADPNEGNLANYTALMAAISAGNQASVEHLLNAGADVAAATILWDSTGAGWPDVENYLFSGQTVLMIAASTSTSETIRMIMKRNPPRSPVDSAGRSACDLLSRNTNLNPVELAELKPLVCRADDKTTQERVVIKTMTLSQLKAAGARRLSRDEVVRITSGAVVQGDNPDGKGTHELRFTSAGTIEGSARTDKGDVLPIKGHWKVDNDAVVCATSAIVIEGMGRRFSLPTVCTQFFQLGDTRYAVKGDAGENDIVRALPKPGSATGEAKSK